MEVQRDPAEQFVRSALIVIKENNLHHYFNIDAKKECKQKLCILKLVKELLADKNIDNNELFKNLAKQVAVTITNSSKHRRVMMTFIDILYAVCLHFHDHISLINLSDSNELNDEDCTDKCLLHKQGSLVFEGEFRCNCGHSGSIMFNSSYLCESIEADLILTGLDSETIKNIALLSYPLLKSHSDNLLFTNSKSKILKHLLGKFLKYKCTSSSCNKPIELQNLKLFPFHGIFIININNKNGILYSTENLLLLNSIPFVLDLSKTQDKTSVEKLYLKSIIMSDGFNCKVINSSYIHKNRLKFYYESIFKGLFPSCLIYSRENKNLGFQLDHNEFLSLMKLSAQFDLLKINRNWFKPQLNYWEIVKEDLKDNYEQKESILNKQISIESFGIRNGLIITNEEKSKNTTENFFGIKLNNQTTPSSLQIHPLANNMVNQEEVKKNLIQSELKKPRSKINESDLDHPLSKNPEKIIYKGPSNQVGWPLFKNHFQTPDEPKTAQQNYYNRTPNAANFDQYCSVCKNKINCSICMNCNWIIVNPSKGCDQCKNRDLSKQVCVKCKYKINHRVNN